MDYMDLDVRSPRKAVKRIGEWPPPPPPKKKSALFTEFNKPPTHLVCNDHLIANFLSFHMSLVVFMNCAGNVLRGFEISVFYLF